MNKIICYYIGKGLDIMNVTVLRKNILLDNTKYKKNNGTVRPRAISETGQDET